MKAQVQGNTLGEMLRIERERAGLSLEKTAGILKVKREYISDLEDDVYEKLPPEVYAKGVLKSYARLLELDEEKTLAIYEEQRRLLEDEKAGEKPVPQKKKFHAPKIIITPEILLGGASVLIVLAIAGYFLREVGNFSKPPHLEIMKPGENETVTEGKIEIEGNTDEGVKLQINGENIGLSKGGSFQTDVVLMKGINEIGFQAENKFGKKTEKKLVVNYNPSESPLPVIKKRVLLKTDSDPVWVNVVNSEGEITETLSAGSVKTVEIGSETKIIVEKGDSVYFTEDNGDLTIFGETGERTERVFNP